MNQQRQGPFYQPDLAVVGVLALIALAAVALELHSLVRAVFAVPLVLFLPGYAVLSALAPARSLEPIERLLVALGLSFAAAIVAGLLLALTPFGLSALSWAVMLAGLTVVASVVAWVRRVRSGIEGPQLPRLTARPSALALMLIAALIAGDALLGNSLTAVQQDNPAPEQLWMVPAGDEVRLGMRAGPGGGDYDVRLSSAGEVILNFELTLAEGETWERLVVVPTQARQQALVARLYRGADGTELRFVFLQPPTP